LIKRTFDFVLAAALLVVLSPLMLMVALAIRLTIGSPILFRQQRPGLGGRTFELVKFRSMSNERSHDGRLLNDEERMEPFGSILRTTSLDELPELWNILKGDMSLVGPRPLLTRYLPHYTTRQAKRHDVRPGLTGWAQVNGRNAISWDQKLEYDAWYVDSQSFWLDLRILLRTVKQLFLAHGISQADRPTVEAFDEYLVRTARSGEHPGTDTRIADLRGRVE
jgi:sugar transferase EpsL